MAAIPTPPNDEPVGHDYELRAWDELLADLEERPLADGLQSQPRERPNLTLIEGGDDPMPTAPKTRADLLEYLDWQERWPRG